MRFEKVVFWLFVVFRALLPNVGFLDLPDRPRSLLCQGLVMRSIFEAQDCLIFVFVPI